MILNLHLLPLYKKRNYCEAVNLNVNANQYMMITFRSIQNIDGYLL